MKKLLTIITVLLLASYSKYPTPIPEINTVNFEKKGGSATIAIKGNATFNDNMRYETELEENSHGLTSNVTMKCGWVTFKLHFPYKEDNVNLDYCSPDLIITAEPNDTGEQRTFKLGLVNVLDESSRPHQATVTVIQKRE